MYIVNVHCATIFLHIVINIVIQYRHNIMFIVLSNMFICNFEYYSLLLAILDWILLVILLLILQSILSRIAQYFILLKNI